MAPVASDKIIKYDPARVTYHHLIASFIKKYTKMLLTSFTEIPTLYYLESKSVASILQPFWALVPIILHRHKLQQAYMENVQ